MTTRQGSAHARRGARPIGHRAGARAVRSRTRRPPSRGGAVLTGRLRWLDPAGAWAALLVTDAGGSGRRLIGETVTLELEATRFRTADRNGDGRVDARDLLPGDTVTVKVRLDPGAGAPPESIAPDRLIADVP